MNFLRAPKRIHEVACGAFALQQVACAGLEKRNSEAGVRFVASQPFSPGTVRRSGGSWFGSFSLQMNPVVRFHASWWEGKYYEAAKNLKSGWGTSQLMIIMVVIEVGR